MSFDPAFFNNMDVSINIVDQTLLNTYNNLDISINNGSGFDGAIYLMQMHYILQL